MLSKTESKRPRKLKLPDISLPQVVVTVIVVGMFYLSLNSRLNDLNSNVLSLKSEVDASVKIKVLNTERMMSELLSDGFEPAEALLYSDTLFKVLEAQGFTVLSPNSVLSSNESFRLELMDDGELYKLASELGVAPSEQDRRRIKRAIKDTKSRSSKVFSHAELE